MTEPLLQQPVFHQPAGTSFAARREALIDYYADRPPSGYYPRLGFIEVAARLYRGRPLGTILPTLDRLLGEPYGDMFWMYPMVLTTYVGRERLPEAVRERMRALWRTYTPYRGDTENHWLLYYASLYLIAQAYPDDPAETWFNGRSAEEHRTEALGYLDHWIDLTTRRGQGEYDSPHYLACYLAPLALLYAFAEAPGVRRRAEMMLDYLIADFAADTLDGLYTGAFSRIYPEPTLERWRNGSTSLAWLLFGTAPFRPDAVNVVLPRAGYRPHGMAAVLAMSGYAPPEAVVACATERGDPYRHRERKRTRHRIRYSDARNAPVYKTTYMTPDYAVGSTQGGLLQPVQQHTWEVLWATDDPHAGFNVLFTLHPYAGPRELGMYFPEEPKLLEAAVVRHEKGTYGSPEKWTGGSPYEQVVQADDAVVVLYDLPEGTRFPHISGYFSRALEELTEDPSGWIVARGGRAWIGYYPLAPYVWRDEPGGDRRLHSDALQNGAVVQVAAASDYATREAFLDALRACPIKTHTAPTPSVDYTTLRGVQVEATYGETPRLDGAPVDYDAWPLFGGPLLQADVDSRRLTVTAAGRRRVLDFTDLSITDTPA